jgi:hypothetical protein
LARLRKQVRVLEEERDIVKNQSRAVACPTCAAETPRGTLAGPALWPSAFW